MGKFLIFTGLLVVVIGLVVHFKVQIPWLTGWIGTLPGDLIIKKKNVTIYLPVATSVLISVVLSLGASLFFGNKK